MLTTIILAILGFALLVVIVAMFRAPSGRLPAGTGAAIPPPAPAHLDVDAWDARKGDVISISGAAEDYSDVDFPVDRRSAYESSNRRWVDLSGEFRGRRVYLEVYRYPKPEYMGILDSRKLTLADIGVSEEQLGQFDVKQDPAAFLEYESKRWLYDSSREVGYFENEAGQGEGLYRWLFREEGGSRILCIEKWEGEPFDVRMARDLNARDITVYRSSGSSGAV